ncbi:MAG TPA: DMT family transporter [Actinomycetota bacterium]
MEFPVALQRSRAESQGQQPLAAYRWISSLPLLAVTFGAVVIAFSAILVRLSGASPEAAATYRCVYAVPVLWLLAFLEDRQFGRRPLGDRLLAVPAGVLLAADLILWHHAIGAVGAGLATVLANLQVVIVGLAAWVLLHERPGRLLAAVPLALFGVLLVSGLLERGASGSDPALGVLFGSVASLCYAAFLLLLRHLGRDLRRPAGPLFDVTAVAAVGCAAAGLVLDPRSLVPSWPAQGWLVLLALLPQVVGWLLISVALPRLPAALGSALLLIQPASSVGPRSGVARRASLGLPVARRCPDSRRGAACRSGRGVAVTSATQRGRGSHSPWPNVGPPMRRT